MQITLKQKIISNNKQTTYLIFDIDKNFKFKEWQFVMLETEILWNKIKRAYSVANTQKELTEKWEIHLLVKKVSENWMSNYLTQNINIWDTLVLQGPFGHMTNNETKDNYLFISIWSWLAAILPIYKKLILEDKKYNKIANIFGERDLDYVPENVWNIYENNLENIKNISFFSRCELPEWWRTKWQTKVCTWHVQDWIQEAMEFLWTKDINVFICGKPTMVKEIMDVLGKYWISKDNINFEQY